MTSEAILNTNQTDIKNIKSSPVLCLGIDPVAEDHTFEGFEKSLGMHREVLLALGVRCRVLKPNLAFFLVWGHQGIHALESFCDSFRLTHKIILDAKFSEMQNSLERYLVFAFQVLKVQGITLNPFLGSGSLHLALNHCAKYVGPFGRVYTLCATSEAPGGELSHIQADWKKTFIDVEAISRGVFANDERFSKIAGVVIGANRTEVLDSSTVKYSSLSLLAPGLGAQGAETSAITKSGDAAGEWTFPVSRGIFKGGQISTQESLLHFAEFEKFFKFEE